jgi:hypothetical protein
MTSVSWGVVVYNQLNYHMRTFLIFLNGGFNKKRRIKKKKELKYRYYKIKIRDYNRKKMDDYDVSEIFLIIF